MPTHGRGSTPRRRKGKSSKAGQSQPNVTGAAVDRSAASADLQRELAASRANQRTIVDSTSDLIRAVDAKEFGLLFFNQGLERRLER